MWATAWAFPGSIGASSLDVLNRESLKRATEWNCHDTLGCKRGDCCSQLQTSDVMELRRSGLARAETTTMCGQKATLSMIVQGDLKSAYHRTMTTWGHICVNINDYASVELCPSAYGIVMGLTGSTFYDKVVQPIAKNECYDLVPSMMIPRTRVQLEEHRSLEYSMLSAYVRSLLFKHECQPAPGAAAPSNGQITVMSKTSWKQKWAACETYFKGTAAATPPGSMSMLKRVWKVQQQISELNQMMIILV